MATSSRHLVLTTSLTLLAAAAAPAAWADPHLLHAAPLHGHNPLLNLTADAGDDQTTVGPPSLSALCQSFIGKPNPYRPTYPNVDLIKGDTLVSTGSQTGCSAAQNETTVAVNPRDPRNLVAGTNDYRIFNPRENRNDGSGWAYTSFDGGKSWRNIVLPHLTIQTGATGALSDMDSAGDPAIAFGPDNTVYYANLVFSRLNSASGVVVSKSSDGGLSWSEPSIVHTDGVDASGNSLPTGVFNDKEWITVDQDSGAVYVTWTQFLADGTSPVVVARSHDHGRSWSDPVVVNPAFVPGGITPYSSGTNPQVNSEGTLFIAYESAVCQSLLCNQLSDHDAVIVARSDDGGRTFRNTEVAADYDFPLNPDTGRDTLTGENFRLNSFPQLAIDPASDKLYVTWADDRNGQYDANGNSIKSNGDVLLSVSDNGRKWSQPYVLGTSDDDVYPAVAAYGGHVAVSFYTRHYDPSGTGLDFAWQTVTDDDQVRLGAVHRITTQTADPAIQFLAVGLVSGQVLQGVFIGDYTAIAMGSDLVLHPVWTDFRGQPGVSAPNQDAYTQAIRFNGAQ